MSKIKFSETLASDMFGLMNSDEFKVIFAKAKPLKSCCECKSKCGKKCPCADSKSGKCGKSCEPCEEGTKKENPFAKKMDKKAAKKCSSCDCAEGCDKNCKCAGECMDCSDCNDGNKTASKLTDILNSLLKTSELQDSLGLEKSSLLTLTAAKMVVAEMNKLSEDFGEWDPKAFLSSDLNFEDLAKDMTGEDIVNSVLTDGVGEGKSELLKLTDEEVPEETIDVSSEEVELLASPPELAVSEETKTEEELMEDLELKEAHLALDNLLKNAEEFPLTEESYELMSTEEDYTGDHGDELTEQMNELLEDMSLSNDMDFDRVLKDIEYNDGHDGSDHTSEDEFIKFIMPRVTPRVTKKKKPKDHHDADDSLFEDEE